MKAFIDWLSKYFLRREEANKFLSKSDANRFVKVTDTIQFVRHGQTQDFVNRKELEEVTITATFDLSTPYCIIKETRPIQVLVRRSH